MVPHPLQHSVLSVSSIRAVLIGAVWHLVAVLTCISLMSDDMEHLLICLFAICMSFSGKCLLKLFVHFYSGLFIIEFDNFFYSLVASPLSDMCSADMSSWSVACLFISLTVCFKEQTFQTMMKSNILIFSGFLLLIFSCVFFYHATCLILACTHVCTRVHFICVCTYVCNGAVSSLESDAHSPSPAQH